MLYEDCIGPRTGTKKKKDHGPVLQSPRIGRSKTVILKGGFLIHSKSFTYS